MFVKKVFAALVAAGLSHAPAFAQDATTECAVAGPEAYFCFGDTFNRLELELGEGVSFWMHEDGFLSKVLVEETGNKTVTPAQIETRILQMVSEQAKHFGRALAFSDLNATSVHGVPFGTFSYRLQGGAQNSAVLHSYVAVKGRVLQVVSQIALANADVAPEALERAHAAALRAVKIKDLTSDA